MDSLEIRELRYFVTVAEELHFGRAAERLSIAQPALTKTIQRIEARLNVQLFTRSSRRVALTTAGSALLEHGRHALDAMATAVSSAQRADAEEHVRLVIKPGGDANLLSGILTRYAQYQDAREIDVVFSGGTGRAGFLRDGRADVALLYTPFDDTDGLATRVLHTEDRVAVLPVGHPLAARRSIELADLAGERFPRWKDVPGDGAEPEIETVAELLPLVTIGRVISVLPRSLVRPTPPGVICVPVTDAGPSHVVIARQAQDHRPAVAALIEAAVTAPPSNF
ncbi:MULTISPECIES: LysR family transcriptional regulator [unclassified Saccharopolyspora]|uniref:LysR family transcriptional regulator n=1 Tax=unclassified Saccharopolyspora TaxID=2646250 RepID=UPI001CD2BE04|nr:MULTISPECIES: LysR family transcriptional regulator [unclassified Saccharopolyspora]MCA1190256.1 LysR family transcriptional regulator [Saccharopolyspora sp. 6T]MCA1192625.1 LysR family transcriptional regulator [Saccharopolyspora sp. 6V]MCA1229713.1 LysR family transcriptional regulator [Saccharopolyspora sp. 6M]MCA1283444.1 LysR family transcriptional regulator [Saccharopolyspora sp. 7B]